MLAWRATRWSGLRGFGGHEVFDDVRRLVGRRGGHGRGGASAVEEVASEAPAPAEAEAPAPARSVRRLRPAPRVKRPRRRRMRRPHLPLARRRPALGRHAMFILCVSASPWPCLSGTSG